MRFNNTSMFLAALIVSSADAQALTFHSGFETGSSYRREKRRAAIYQQSLRKTRL